MLEFDLIKFAIANECCSTPPICGKKYSEQINIFMFNFKFLIRFSISFFLLIFIYRLYSFDTGSLINEIKKFNINFLNIFGLVLLVLFGIYLTTIRYFYITKLLKIKISFFKLLIINLSQFSLNNLSFSGVGEIYKYLKLERKKLRLKLVFSILVERYLTILVLTLVVVFFILSTLFENLFLICTFTIALIIFFLNLEKFIPNIFKKFPYVDYYNVYYGEVIKLFSVKKKEQIYLLINSALIQFVSIIFYFYLFNFIGNIQVDLYVLIFVIPIINFFNALPISIAGIGVRDIAFIFVTSYILENDILLFESLTSTGLIGIFLIIFSTICLLTLKVLKKI